MYVAMTLILRSFLPHFLELRWSFLPPQSRVQLSNHVFDKKRRLCYVDKVLDAHCYRPGAARVVDRACDTETKTRRRAAHSSARLNNGANGERSQKLHRVTSGFLQGRHSAEWVLGSRCVQILAFKIYFWVRNLNNFSCLKEMFWQQCKMDGERRNWQ